MFEKLKKIITEVCDVDEDKITMDSTFKVTWTQIPWMYSRLLQL